MTHNQLEKSDLYTKQLRDQLELKGLELGSLLELTTAIQNNLPEESLYRIFKFTLIGSLKVSRFALFSFDEDISVCKLTNLSEVEYTQLPQSLKGHHLITRTQEKDAPWDNFDVLVPVLHKEKVLAILLLGGLQIVQIEENEYLDFIQTYANILMVAIENKRFARQQVQQESMRKELEIARNVQQNLFPNTLPKGRKLHIDAFYLPHRRVGGDYYDYIPLDEHRFLICIADISGKGVPASLLMSNFHASLNALIRQNQDLDFLVHELNHLVYKSSKGENFITAFLGIYDGTTRNLHYVNAGHNPPVLVLPGNGHVLLEKGTTVLGVFESLPLLEQGRTEGLDRFYLFAYTDGLEETRNLQGEEFGISRLIDLLITHSMDIESDISKLVIDELDSFRNGTEFIDDVTFIGCRVNQL